MKHDGKYREVGDDCVIALRLEVHLKGEIEDVREDNRDKPVIMSTKFYNYHIRAIDIMCNIGFDFTRDR